MKGSSCPWLQLPCLCKKKKKKNDIFKNVKALVKKRTRLAISYSRLLFSPFLLARKATEQLYKSLTPSSATQPLFLVCWTHDSKSIIERGKLQFVGKIHLISPSPPTPNSFAYNPPTPSFFRFHPHRVTPFATPRRRLYKIVHGNG